MTEDLDSVKSSIVEDVVAPTPSEEVASDANIPSNTQDIPSSTQDSKPEFSADEETLIARMYNLLGERWSLIAGRIPGRSAEEIEKYWNSRHSSSTTQE